MLETHDLRAPYGLTAPLNLHIAAGGMHGLLGPNGAGKSTALRLLAGLLRPTAGRVELEGVALGERSRRHLAQRIAFTPQDCELLFDFTVRALVQMGRHPWRKGLKGPSAADRRAVDEAMEAMQITQFADRSARALSGGERQRVFIARALAQQTPILLLDEPTAHLDFGRRTELMRLLARLQADRGLTVVIALHDLNLAALFCSRVSLLAEGRLVAEGPPAQVMTQALMSRTFGHGLRQVEGRTPPQFLPVRSELELQED